MIKPPEHYQIHIEDLIVEIEENRKQVEAAVRRYKELNGVVASLEQSEKKNVKPKKASKRKK